MAKSRKYIILLLSVVALSQGLWAQRAVDRVPSLPDSVATDVDMLPVDTMQVAVSDTLVNDTTKKRDELEAPVIYESKDSMVWYKNGNAYLYGDGQVNYQRLATLPFILCPTA